MRKRSSVSAAIVITPLVDVLLVLICILILAATASVKSLGITLPDAQLGEGYKAAQTLKITIDKNSNIFVNKEQTPIKKEDLASLIDPKATTVQIFADASLDYQSVMTVLDAVAAVPAKEVQLMSNN